MKYFLIIVTMVLVVGCGTTASYRSGGEPYWQVQSGPAGVTTSVSGKVGKNPFTVRLPGILKPQILKKVQPPQNSDPSPFIVPAIPRKTESQRSPWFWIWPQ